MGNSNCTKCLQDCDVSKEIDLKPSVITIQIILRAYGNTRNSTSFDNISRRPLRPERPQNLYASAQEVECIIKLQSMWRSFTCQKQYSLVKRLVKLNYPYFSHEELTCTLSSQVFNPDQAIITKEFKYPNGSTYRGEWLGGFRHGTGNMTWPDKSCYSGTFSFGYASGFGVFTHSLKNESYKGQFLSPFAGSNSSGMTPRNKSAKNYVQDGYLWLWLLYEESSRQEGPKKASDPRPNFLKAMQKIQSQIEAQELIIKEMTSQLEEYFEDFQNHYNVIQIDQHTKYWGERKDEQRSGFGINQWENGDKYSGEWKNDLQHGRGWNCWTDGSSYVGGYINGLKDGLGLYIWDDGTRYSGGWKDNFIEGVGHYQWKDGREYHGEWKNGHMHGIGIFLAKDKKKYHCPWVNGKKHGPGFIVLKDGSSVNETWLNGKTVKKDEWPTNIN